MYTHITSQDTLSTSATTSVTTTYGSSASYGNLLVASVVALGVGLGSISISGWTVAVSQSFLSAADAVAILYKISAGNETSVVASCSGATSMVQAIHEFATVTLSSLQTWTDVTNTANGGVSLVTSQQTGSITPTKTNDLIITAMCFPTGGTSAWNWNSGVTTMNSNVNMTDGFLIDNNVNAINPTASWTGSSTAGGCIASFLNTGTQFNSYSFIDAGSGISVTEKIR